MDELEEFCARMLGDREAAGQLAREARQAGSDRRIQVSRAVAACRDRRPSQRPPAAASGADLGAAVAAEVAGASARLPEADQELLALRDVLGLGHADLAAAAGLEAAEVAGRLGEARIRLRAELRQTPVSPARCGQRPRTLHTATLRQDSEGVTEDDEDWLFDHLGGCAECARAHAAMLEGDAAYRSWRT